MRALRNPGPTPERRRLGEPGGPARTAHAASAGSSFTVEARGDSEWSRVVLTFHIWNLFVDPAERELVGGLVSAVWGYYRAED